MARCRPTNSASLATATGPKPPMRFLQQPAAAAAEAAPAAAAAEPAAPGEAAGQEAGGGGDEQRGEEQQPPLQQPQEEEEQQQPAATVSDQTLVQQQQQRSQQQQQQLHPCGPGRCLSADHIPEAVEQRVSVWDWQHHSRGAGDRAGGAEAGSGRGEVSGAAGGVCQCIVFSAGTGHRPSGVCPAAAAHL